MRAGACAIAGALLAACSGSPFVGATGWPHWSTIPASQRSDLLYVSDYEANDVYFYSYPDGKRVGMLAGILSNSDYPAGLCSDAGGDVFIPDSANATVLEYAHGGTQPIAQLGDANEYPYSCAVDPTSGNLAVVNFESFHGAGSVSVYSRARGTPVLYSYGYAFNYYFAAYDDRGNLFIDATYDTPSTPFIFLELKKGRKALRIVTLEQAFRAPGGVAWDGYDVAVKDAKSSTIYRFAIRGGVGKKKGFVKLRGADDLMEFFVANGNLVGARFHGSAVDQWKYPRGGEPEKRFGNFREPFGVTLSKAPQPRN